MYAYTRPLTRRRPNATERSAQILLLSLALVGIGMILLLIACYMFEPHIVVAALVLAILFLVFRIESRPQYLPMGGFYPSRSARYR